MKKAFSLFLTIAIVFSLAACNQNEDKGKSASPPPESIVADSAPVEPSGETQPESQVSTEETTGSTELDKNEHTDLGKGIDKSNVLLFTAIGGGIILAGLAA